MSKPFKSDLAQQTSGRIYKELLNVGAPTSRKTIVRGKVNKRPAFSLGKVKGREQDSDLLPLEFYNFHYTKSPQTGALREDESRHDLRKHNTSPCPSVMDNFEEDSMVQMLKIRATSAYVRNPECYQRNPEFFLSCTPTERRNMSNQKPVVWNRSHQALRLDKEWNAKAQCRATKLHSELVKHRTDKMYILNGAALNLKNRYSISEDETQHLRELSLARQELRNELQEARDIHNRSTNISALRSRSRSESVKLPRLSAKSKNVITDSNTIGMITPQDIPSNNSNPQNIGFTRKASETPSITVVGTQNLVDKQNDEIQAEMSGEPHFVAVDGGDQENTAVDQVSEDDTKLRQERDVGVDQPSNECNHPGVDCANNIDNQITQSIEIDTTHSIGDPKLNQYDEDTEVALQFYEEIEDGDDNVVDNADR